MPTQEISPGYYRHYKGNMYEVIGIAKHSETLEDMVVYCALYEGEFPEGQLWIRPLSMFSETVEIDGHPLPRFKRVEDYED